MVLLFILLSIVYNNEQFVYNIEQYSIQTLFLKLQYYNTEQYNDNMEQFFYCIILSILFSIVQYCTIFKLGKVSSVVFNQCNRDGLNCRCHSSAASDPQATITVSSTLLLVSRVELREFRAVHPAGCSFFFWLFTEWDTRSLDALTLLLLVIKTVLSS